MNAQDAATEATYFIPSQQIADAANVQTALGRAVFYDTIIQHGGGNDPDSIGALVDRTAKSFGATPTAETESSWLHAFLEMRRQDLLNPANTASQKVWAQSVDRVNFLESLLSQGNLDLHGPIEMDPKHPSSDSHIP